MARSVVDGVLKQVSPSSINAFDASTAFGCERRWYFRYVMDKVEPQTGSTQLGTNVHKMNEIYLRDGKLLLSTEEATRLFQAGREYLDEIKPSVISVEASVKADLAGVPLVGFCDVVTKTGIIDWKTSSNVGRYGKKGFELANDTQMLVYAQALLPHLDSWKLVHGQYQTKGKLSFQLAEGLVYREALDTRFNNVIIPLVERMKSAAGEKDVEALQADRNKCGRCPHSLYCPKDENPIMSILSSFKKTAPVATQAPASVVPPDAPKSDPALAAKPVEGFTPPVVTGVSPTGEYITEKPKARMNIVDEEPSATPTAPEAPAAELAPAPAPLNPTQEEIAAMLKPAAGSVVARSLDTPHVTPPPAPKRGRPAGSKNKATVPPLQVSVPVGEPREDAAGNITVPTANFTIKTITISHGATINLGNFNSSRCDVSMTAEVGADVDTAYAALDTLVKTKLLAEVEAYSKAAEVKVTK